MNLNFIDILLLVIVVLSVLNGYRRGFIRGVLDLLGWVLGLIAALRYYQPVANWIGPRVEVWSDVWDQPIAFILIAAVTACVVYILGEVLLKRIPERVHERTLNKIFGTIPGLANGLVSAAILSALLLAIPLNEMLRERARESTVVNQLAGYAERLEAALHPVFSDAIARTLNLLTVQPQSDERIDLPYKLTSSQPRQELEARMLELVNRERAAAGLKQLALDPELTEVARRHSTDMFVRGYFAHDTPEGKSPFDRMHDAHVNFLAAGENLALAPTVQLAHTGLMHSPGHRANILNKDFGRVGIGIMDGGIRGLMVTQNFRN